MINERMNFEIIKGTTPKGMHIEDPKIITYNEIPHPGIGGKLNLNVKPPNVSSSTTEERRMKTESSIPKSG